MKSMTSSIARFQTPLLLIGLLGIAALVGVTGGPTVERVAILALISAAFVVGLSTFTANSGVMSFGHVTFMAAGAYTTAYLTIPVKLKATLFSDLPSGLAFLAKIHADFPVAVLAGGLVAAVLGVLTSPVIARLSGLQSGIATLAILIVVYTVLNSWTAVTRGSSSMVGIPQNTGLGIAFAAAAAAVIIAFIYQQSGSALQLRASREDVWAAAASGIQVGRHRAYAWVLSSFLCGLSGALYAGLLTSFNVSAFFISTTFAFVVMAVIGGYLSLSGAIVGALPVSVLQELLRRLQDGQFTGGAALPAGIADLVLAAVLLVVLVKRPLGIMGIMELRFPKKRLWSRSKSDRRAVKSL